MTSGVKTLIWRVCRKAMSGDLWKVYQWVADLDETIEFCYVCISHIVKDCEVFSIRQFKQSCKSRGKKEKLTNYIHIDGKQEQSKLNTFWNNPSVLVLWECLYFKSNNSFGLFQSRVVRSSW